MTRDIIISERTVLFVLSIIFSFSLFIAGTNIYFCLPDDYFKDTKNVAELMIDNVGDVRLDSFSREDDVSDDNLVLIPVGKIESYYPIVFTINKTYDRNNFCQPKFNTSIQAIRCY